MSTCKTTSGLHPLILAETFLVIGFFWSEYLWEIISVAACLTAGFSAVL